MKVALICSNWVKIAPETKKGTEIWIYNYLINLKKYHPEIEVKVSAASNSIIPYPLISIDKKAIIEEKEEIKQNQKLFELALISKASSLQENFDLFHVNIGNGEVILPFAPFIKKPILITLHGSLDHLFYSRYYPLFSHLKNVFFVSISNYQRKPIPYLNYLKTIYNGVDTSLFKFSEKGDNYILWTGRGIPEKGIEQIIEVFRKTKKTTKIFAIRKEKYLSWLINLKNQNQSINFNFEINQSELIKEYQNAKLFLNPIQWEEPFGLVMIESMACGTPVVAFAKGSVPEVIKDGETGFIVNPSDEDKRGDWIIKKTGLEGLCEAVERIYSMPQDQYRQMRRNCRAHVEKNFTVERMVDDYEKVYQEIINAKKTLI